MPHDAGPRSPDCRGLPALSRGATAAVVLAALGYPALLTWAYFVALSGQGKALQQGVYLAGKLLQFGLPLLWVLGVEWRDSRQRECHGHLARAAGCHGHFARALWKALAERQWHPAGNQWHTGVAQGLLFGTAVLAATLIGYHAWAKPASVVAAAGEAIRAKLLAFGVDSPAKYIALGAFYSLAHSFLEEYYWRWFAFGRLGRFVPTWSAIAISSIALACSLAPANSAGPTRLA